MKRRNIAGRVRDALDSLAAAIASLEDAVIDIEERVADLEFVEKETTRGPARLFTGPVFPDKIEG